MVKTLVIVGHPNADNSGMQQFFKESVQNFFDVTYYYVEPELTSESIIEARQLLATHQRIVFQFPVYWYSMPGQLKIWLDEVLETQASQTSLSGKELGLVVNFGVAEKGFQAGAKERFTVSELFRPFEAMTHKLGMTYLPILSIFQFYYLTELEQQKLAVRYQEYLTKENNTSFLTKERWMLERLNYFLTKETHSERYQKIQIVLDQMNENRDLLTSLEESLDWLKEGE
ncbi:hypothetical protein CBF34_02370 [Vagococcus penaei]|uniref:Uncharacterized protein n=1 Tax=Vagococcus penaei TaxID=633807 RepID=A0A1Q2D7R6_9ENTE|nr:NAD(P)H-dependent oxidoreductase [Vagococcus penaei]AQP54466.1 hypothetical protein BW732_09675 [Vagococcus penaei]RSU06385.1 hypothetical protein CBF34_02370 [Vagococcus penaei]